MRLTIKTPFQNNLIKELDKLKDKSHVDKIIFYPFAKRITEGKLTREENLENHLCSFFVPVHKSSKSIFIGHHVKADEWIPPGGHINKDEAPIETVFREFYEELNFKLTDEKTELFDLDRIDTRPGRTNPCKVHYDFWYLVFMNEQSPFTFDKREFYDAGWFSIDDAVIKCRFKPYVEILKKIRTILL